MKEKKMKRAQFLVFLKSYFILSSYIIGSTRFLEVLISVLPHSSSAPRAAAAWCLHCMAIACPTHLTPAIDVCLEGLENLRSSPEAVVGYSSALAALLGAVRYVVELNICLNANCKKVDTF